MSNKSSPPRVLLIGAGHFGRNHLRVLKDLERKNLLVLEGVVVSTPSSKARIKKEFGVNVFTSLTKNILLNVDAVDIVTPPKTHFKLAKRCLPHADVFVEKPLTENAGQARALGRLAKKNKRVIMVGHIFRFNEAVKKLKVILKSVPEKPYLITGGFITPGPPDRGAGAILTFIHHFDILDFLLGVLPISVYARARNTIRKKGSLKDEALVVLAYPGGTNAVLSLGWGGTKKIRTVEIYFYDRKIYCNLLSQEITIHFPHRRGKKIVSRRREPLKEEIITFMRAVSGRKISYPDGDTGERVVRIAEAAKTSARQNKVVGYGSFN